MLLFLIFQNWLRITQSGKMSKRSRKAKAPISLEKALEKFVVIADTTCLGLGKISWEGIYALLEVENPMEVEE